MRISLLSIVILGALGLPGCDTGPKGAGGFSLPDGDAVQGKAGYISFQCNLCHSIDSVPQSDKGVALMAVPLGGEKTRIKSYGELVTSIINPSHKISRHNPPDVAHPDGTSKMVIFNDVMTVTQLIDLVAFVQSSYTLSPYRNTPYPVYWIPEPAEKKQQP